MMQGGGHGHSQDTTDSLLERLVEELIQNAEDPPREVKGVSDEFLAQLDRVPKTSLKDKDCPICGNPFLDGDYTSHLTPTYLCSCLFQILILLSSSCPVTKTTSSILNASLPGSNSTPHALWTEKNFSRKNPLLRPQTMTRASTMTCLLETACIFWCFLVRLAFRAAIGTRAFSMPWPAYHSSYTHQSLFLSFHTSFFL